MKPYPSLSVLRLRGAGLVRSGLAALAALLFLAAPVGAQASGAGIVEGRVFNATTGRYIPNVRVTIEGTNLEAQTNNFGEYRIANVPAGQVIVRAFFTGQPPLTDTVAVQPGAVASQDFTFRPGAQVREDGTVVMEAFVVAAKRETDAHAIAINEERFAPNFKNVVSADAFGAIPEGNIGEFVKFIPGVEVNYGGTYTSEADATGISIRGFGPEDTMITIDGVPVSNASPASLTRAIGLDMLSINNAARVEVVKVPTPDMPNNSIGGSVNLISKTAFEYARPTFRWSTYLSINSQNLDIFSKQPGPTDKKQFTTLPGFDFTYAHPISRTLGISITGASSNQFNENQRARPEYQFTPVTLDLRPIGGANSATLVNAAGKPSDITNPWLNRFSLTDSPRYSSRHSGAFKVDWRPVPDLLVTANYQLSIYDSADAARRLQFRVNRAQDWGPDFTKSYQYLAANQTVNGAVFNPGAAVDMNIDSRDKEGTTNTGYLTLKYDRGPWQIGATGSFSSSTGSYKDTANGHFSTVDMSLQTGRVEFRDVEGGVPGQILVYNRAGDLVDYTRLQNWTLSTLQARSGEAESQSDRNTYKLDVRRELDFLPWDSFSLALKAGFYREENIEEKSGLGTGYRESYVGPALTLSDFADDVYTDIEPGYGFPAQQWVSTYKLYDFYLKNRSLFNADSESDKINNWNSFVNQNKKIKETNDAWYAQLEGKFLRNRLNMVAGLRQETSKREGFGPYTDSRWNYVKNPDGTLYRNATYTTGVRIDQATSPLFATTQAGIDLRNALTSAGVSFPTTPVLANTLAARQLQLQPLKPVEGESKGDPSYSINLAYDITEQIVARVAWSRTFGRIDFESGNLGLLSGNNQYTINENTDPAALPRGTITVANPNLKPWTSDNWDFGLSYYSKSLGKFSVGYFTKNVENFHDTFDLLAGAPEFDTVLDSLGLDRAEYEDWLIRTTINGIGTAKTYGYEFSYLQNLGFIGEWARNLNVFANYTTKKREESGTTKLSAKLSSDDTASFGVNLNIKRLSVSVKGTWRDVTYESTAATVTYNGQQYIIGNYYPAELRMDLNCNSELTKRLGLFLNARNFNNSGREKNRYDLTGLYPEYAHIDDLREFGVQYTIGIRGTF